MLINRTYSYLMGTGESVSQYAFSYRCMKSEISKPFKKVRLPADRLAKA